MKREACKIVNDTEKKQAGKVFLYIFQDTN